MNLDIAADREGRSDRFATTHWSMVLSCSDCDSDTEKAQRALADLCRIYWRPIFAFIHRRGYTVPDAQDLTQGFFLTVLEGKLLQRANPSRGRFRSLLLKALQDFLIDDSIRNRALKRGGKVRFVSWDEWMAESISPDAIPAIDPDHCPPEELYDARWAATAASNALRQLGEECEQRGRREMFDALADYLSADREDISYHDLAEKLGVSDSAVKRLLHQFRVRFRELLRDEVAKTVLKPDEVEEELRYLCAALAMYS